MAINFLVKLTLVSSFSLGMPLFSEPAQDSERLLDLDTQVPVVESNALPKAPADGLVADEIDEPQYLVEQENASGSKCSPYEGSCLRNFPGRQYFQSGTDLF